MTDPTSPGLFDTCKGYIEALALPAKTKKKSRAQRPAITLSRECGTGAVTISSILAGILDEELPGPTPWALFDKNLVARVLADHALPDRLARYLPEDVPGELTAAVEEMLGLHPDDWTLLQHVTDTLLKLGTAGGCILVGRGANIVTAHLPSVLHVRLVAPLDFRVAHFAEETGVSKKEARVAVPKADRARARYLRKHFGAAVDDPLRYHLTLNTARTGFDGAARILADALQQLAG